MNEFVCKCTQCNNLLIDLDPTDRTLEMDVTDIHLTLEQFKDDDSDDYLWGCPICKTDHYLKDINQNLEVIQ